MFSKPKVGVLLLSIFCLRWIYLYALANICFPTFDGNWYVEGDCIYPSGGYKIFGNIYVGRKGDFTVTIPDGVTMGIDLSVNKIDFTDGNDNIKGKIILQGSAKIDNSVRCRYYYQKSYTSNGVTSCPSGTVVLYTDISKGVITKGEEEKVSFVGNMYCAKIGSNSSFYNCRVEKGVLVCESKKPFNYNPNGCN